MAPNKIVNFAKEFPIVRQFDGDNPDLESNLLDGVKISSSGLEEVHVGVLRSGTTMKIEAENKPNISPEQLASISSFLFAIRAGVGVNNFDLQALADVGVVVTNTPKATTESVSEHAVGLLYDLLKRTSLSQRKMKNGEWKKESTEELQGKKVLVIGAGNIGLSFAAKMKSLGAEAILYDPYSKYKGFLPNGPIGEHGKLTDNTFSLDGEIPIIKTNDELHELLSSVDIISLHTPDVKEPVLGKDEMAHIIEQGNTPYVINTGRPSALDYESLLSGLKGGALRGVGLDVFPEEGARFSETEVGQTVMSLLNDQDHYPNIVVSHHAAGNSKEGQQKVGEEAAGYINQLREGKIVGISGLRIADDIPDGAVRAVVMNQNVSGATAKITEALAQFGLNLDGVSVQKGLFFGGTNACDIESWNIMKDGLSIPELAKAVKKALDGVEEGIIMRGFVAGGKQ